jgi:hypothetical protein
MWNNEKQEFNEMKWLKKDESFKYLGVDVNLSLKGEDNIIRTEKK